MGLEGKQYFLATAHRQENVDDKKRFEGILNGLQLVADEFNMPVIYPIHPRARKMMNKLLYVIAKWTLTFVGAFFIALFGAGSSRDVEGEEYAILISLILGILMIVISELM